MATLHTVLAAWPIWAPIVTVLLASLVTRLTPYPKAAGVVTALRVVLDVLSFWTHRDSPGTWQVPLVQRSAPPVGVPETSAPQVPPAVVLLALLLVPTRAIADVVVPRPEDGTGTPRMLALFLVLTPVAFCAIGLLWSLGGLAWRRLRAQSWTLALLLLALPLAGCGATTKQIAATATIATVQTIDEGIGQFTAWAEKEDDAIAEAALLGCQGTKATVPEYNACTAAIVTPRRAPIDKARAAIRLYRAALSGGEKLAQRDLAITAQAVIEALAAVGIRVAAGGVL